MQKAAAIDDLMSDGCRRDGSALQRLGRALLIGCLALAGLSAPAAALPVVQLSAQTPTLPLDGRAGHLADRAGTLDAAQLHAMDQSNDFELPPDPVRSGTDGTVHWFKLRLQQDALQDRWVLTLPAAQNLQGAELFGPCAESSLAQAACDAEPPPRATTLAGASSPAFLLSAPGPGVFSVYLRVQAGLPQNLSLSISTLAAHDAAQQTRRLLDGAGYGLLVGLVLFGWLLHWTFRERIYLGFMADVVAAIATIALLNGDVGRYLFASTPWITDRLLLALVPLWIVFALRQSLVHLNLRRHLPQLAGAFRLLIGAAAFAALAALAGGVQLPSLLAAVVGLAGLALLPFVSAPMLKFGRRFTPLHLFTSVLGCLLAVLKLADLWALLPAWPGRLQLFQWSMLASALLYAGMFGNRLSRVWMRQGELRAHAAQLSRAAATDPLTGLANRAGLKDRAEMLARTREAWALLLIDLDHFKPINDSFGHEAGDAVLVAIAERLRASVGPSDLAARLGGDEFALLLVGPREGAALAACAQASIDAISAPIELRGRMHRIGASVGVARAPGNGSELARLLRGGDQALYRAKRQGRGGYAFFEGTAPQTTAAATL